MSAPTTLERTSATRVLLGDEAVALGAIHAGATAAYAYPGTPATEIQEAILKHGATHEGPHACWCVNEKTALEQALGVSMAGRRALVSMKHVGLNVASDPFINAAIVSIQGGLVVAVADDPGMHSSQNEQDSRFYADFARTICLEPADQQEAYEMTREAFDISERFHVPVVVRLVTRLAHSRAVVTVGPPRPENELHKVEDPRAWTLLPANARRQWRSLLDRQAAIRDFTAASKRNTAAPEGPPAELGVITAGVARGYFLENLPDLPAAPPMLHVGAYPLPVDSIRALASRVRRLLVLEEGYPFIERSVKGLLPTPVEVLGRETGHVPADGELTPEHVRAALGIPARPSREAVGMTLPGRPPQLCEGCPHRDAYTALQLALAGFDRSLVASDIGCYTLGALPPYQAIESCVCMGASIGMAKGASEAGLRPAIAVIGDSTFLHSGVTPLMDAVAADTDMTLIILDNEVVAMTGGQASVLASSELKDLVLGLGVDPAHMHLLTAHPRNVETMTKTIRAELGHPGLSVILCVRECIETARRKKKTGGGR